MAPWAAIARAQASMTPGGRIINVSSTASLRGGTPTNGPYGAAKAALNHLTKTYAIELSRRKIRVNAIAPGPVDTPDLRRSMRIGDEQVAAIGEGVALGRLGQPEDFAAAAVYLASKASDWVTGQVLAVCGGPSWVPPSPITGVVGLFLRGSAGTLSSRKTPGALPGVFRWPQHPIVSSCRVQ